jgi:hypothetical protein
MRISEITGIRVDPRGNIEFDEAERDQYVSRFLAAFNTDIEESQQDDLVYAVHLEICARHDLYSAVYDKLNWPMRTALHRIFTTRYESTLGPSFK